MKPRNYLDVLKLFQPGAQVQITFEEGSAGLQTASQLLAVPTYEFPICGEARLALGLAVKKQEWPSPEARVVRFQLGGHLRPSVVFTEGTFQSELARKIWPGLADITTVVD